MTIQHTNHHKLTVDSLREGLLLSALHRHYRKHKVLTRCHCNSAGHLYNSTVKNSTFTKLATSQLAVAIANTLSY